MAAGLSEARLEAAVEAGLGPRLGSRYFKVVSFHLFFFEKLPSGNLVGCGNPNNMSMFNAMLPDGAGFPSLAQIHFDHCIFKQC